MLSGDWEGTSTVVELIPWVKCLWKEILHLFTVTFHLFHLYCVSDNLPFVGVSFVFLGTTLDFRMKWVLWIFFTWLSPIHTSQAIVYFLPEVYSRAGTP